MAQITGKQRLERLYKRLKKNYPYIDIRFTDETLRFGGSEFVRFKVAYYITVFDEKEIQVCDAICGGGSYGYEEDLLEFYDGGEPEGYITELRAYNLFKKHIEEELNGNNNRR